MGADASVHTVNRLGDAYELRLGGLVVELGFRGNLSRRLKRANKLGACAAVILGDDELAKHVATLRDLDSGDQEEVPLGELAGRLALYRG